MIFVLDERLFVSMLDGRLNANVNFCFLAVTVASREVGDTILGVYVYYLTRTFRAGFF